VQQTLWHFLLHIAILNTSWQRQFWTASKSMREVRCATNRMYSKVFLLQVANPAKIVINSAAPIWTVSSFSREVRCATTIFIVYLLQIANPQKLRTSIWTASKATREVRCATKYKGITCCCRSQILMHLTASKTAEEFA
jgi:hypothetical protein